MNSDTTRPMLLIGHDGMLGRAWVHHLNQAGVRHEAPTLDELDFARPETVKRCVTDRFTAVINCAGYTDVDEAESETDLSRQINGTAVGQLAECCMAAGTLLVHYSTDYVFDGRSQEPYPVGHRPAPINSYGHSKALGEQLLVASGCRFLLIRTSWLYAPWGRNFVLSVADLVRQRQSLSVVNDQTGRPTSGLHLAKTSLDLIRRGARGVYHICDGGRCTWYEFACEIAQRINPACRIEPCASDQFPRPAARPGFSVLDLSETENLLGPMPPWRDNLGEVLDAVSHGEGESSGL